MTLDMFVAKRIDPNHFNCIYFKRENFDSLSFADKLSFLKINLKTWLENNEDVLPEQVNILLNKIQTFSIESFQTDLDYVKLSEYLCAISYYDYEIYVLERTDLGSNDEAIDINNITYLVDNVTSLTHMPVSHFNMAIAKEYSEVSPNLTMAFMDFILSGKYAFDDTVTDVLDLSKIKIEYQAMNERGESAKYDISDLLYMAMGLGQKPIILMNVNIE